MEYSGRTCELTAAEFAYRSGRVRYGDLGVSRGALHLIASQMDLHTAGQKSPSSPVLDALPDLYLVAALRIGTASAMLCLTKQVLTSVRQHLLRYCRANHVDARECVSDLAGDLFLPTGKRAMLIQCFTARSRFSTWLKGIAKHKLFNTYRARDRRQRREDEVARRELRSPYDPLRALERKEAVLASRRAIEGALAELAPAENQLLAKRYMGRKAYAQLAQEFRITERAVHDRRRKALRQVAAGLSCHGLPLLVTQRCSYLSFEIGRCVTRFAIPTSSYDRP